MWKNSLIKILSVAFLLLFLSAAILPAAHAEKQEVYKFGTLMPMTGGAAWIGESFLQGIDLALDEINSKGGVDGIKLEAIKEDHKGNPKDGSNAMNKLATLDKVPFVISSFTAVTLAAQPMAATNKVLLINIGGTSTQLLNKPFLYNNQVMVHQVLPPAADYWWSKGCRKLATVVKNDAFGQGVRDVFVESWKKLGGEVVANELYSEGATDFSAQLSKIRLKKPDVIACSLVGATGVALMKQMREIGIKVPVNDTPGDMPSLEKMGEAAQGIVFVACSVDPDTKSPFARHYVNLYRKTFNKEPVDWLPANGYETVYILAELIKRVKKAGGNYNDGTELLDALEKDPEFPTVYDTKLLFLKDHGVLKKITFRATKFHEGKLETEVVKIVTVDEVPH